MMHGSDVVVRRLADCTNMVVKCQVLVQCDTEDLDVAVS